MAPPGRQSTPSGAVCGSAADSCLKHAACILGGSGGPAGKEFVAPLFPPVNADRGALVGARASYAPAVATCRSYWALGPEKPHEHGIDFDRAEHACCAPAAATEHSLHCETCLDEAHAPQGLLGPACIQAVRADADADANPSQPAAPAASSDCSAAYTVKPAPKQAAEGEYSEYSRSALFPAPTLPRLAARRGYLGLATFHLAIDKPFPWGLQPPCPRPGWRGPTRASRLWIYCRRRAHERWVALALSKALALTAQRVPQPPALRQQGGRPEASSLATNSQGSCGTVPRNSVMCALASHAFPSERARREVPNQQGRAMEPGLQLLREGDGLSVTFYSQTGELVGAAEALTGRPGWTQLRQAGIVTSEDKRQRTATWLESAGRDGGTDAETNRRAAMEMPARLLLKGAPLDPAATACCRVCVPNTAATRNPAPCVADQGQRGGQGQGNGGAGVGHTRARLRHAGGHADTEGAGQWAGGAGNGLGAAQADGGQGDMYWEPQVAQLCQVHASNMELGLRETDPSGALGWLNELDRACRAAGGPALASRAGIYGSSTSGLLSVVAMNSVHFYVPPPALAAAGLRRHVRSVQDARSRPLTITANQLRSSALSALLTPLGLNSVQVHYTKRLSYKHAATIRRDPATDTWWFLDSEAACGPVPLLDTDTDTPCPHTATVRASFTGYGSVYATTTLPVAEALGLLYALGRRPCDWPEDTARAFAPQGSPRQPGPDPNPDQVRRPAPTRVLEPTAAPTRHGLPAAAPGVPQAQHPAACGARDRLRQPARPVTIAATIPVRDPAGCHKRKPPKTPAPPAASDIRKFCKLVTPKNAPTTESTEATPAPGQGPEPEPCVAPDPGPTIPAASQTLAPKNTANAKDDLQCVTDCWAGQVPAARHPKGAPTHKPRPARGSASPQGPTGQTLTVLVANARGVDSYAACARGLAAAHNPHVVILSELQIAGKQRSGSKLRRALPGYKVCASSSATPDGSGVLVAVRQDLAICGDAKPMVFSDPRLGGRLAGLTLVLPRSRPLCLLGVYAHAGDSRKEARAHLYSAIAAEAEEVVARGGVCVMGGDWNATLHDLDRTGQRTANDESHRAAVGQHGWHSLDATPPPRTPSYYRDRSDPSASHSRIDDVLVASTPCAAPRATVTPLEHGPCSDHTPLLYMLDAGTLGQAVPTLQAPRPQTPRVKLRLPIPAAAQEALRAALSDPSCEAARTTDTVHAHLHAITTGEVARHFAERGRLDSRRRHTLTTLTCPRTQERRPAREVVEEQYSSLRDLLLHCNQEAMRICPTVTTNPTGKHYACRRDAKERARLVRQYDALTALTAEARAASASGAEMTVRQLQAQVEARTGSHTAALAALADLREADGEAAPMLNQARRSLRNRIRDADRHKRREGLAKAQKAFRKKFNTQRKKANKQLFAPPSDDPSNPLSALRVPVNAPPGVATTTATEPEQVQRVIEEYYREELQMPLGEPSGADYTDTSTRAYPWDPRTRGAKPTDGFRLETAASQADRRSWLHAIITQEATFDGCMRSLTKGRAPGPDGLINEVLTALPTRIRQCIHMLMQVMWACAVVPAELKHSSTCLLWKGKKSELDLTDYRPIALANTLMKVYTRMVTFAMNEYCEGHSIFSDSQAGFRRFSGCSSRIELLQMAFEDARLHRKPIYMMSLDMTAAFNRISHAKLCEIMYDLGIPTDAIDFVRELYTGATTKFLTPHGPTAPVPILRGTLQGDSLSPLLFLLYIEPLLRWLRVGARGYKWGCLDDQPEGVQVANRLASLAYADDVTPLTSCVSDLHTQAEKVGAFCGWGCLTPNASKSFVSAVLWQNAGRPGTSETDGVARQLEGKIMLTIRDHHTGATSTVPIRYEPPGNPNPCLGVQLTMTMDWRASVKALVQKLALKAERLERSWLTPPQVLRAIEESIKPSIAYSMAVTPFTRAEIEVMDATLGRVLKRAWRLARSTPRAFVREEVAAFGLGCSSVAALANTRAAMSLIDALQDEGMRGTVTLALLTRQTERIKSLAVTDCAAEGRYCMRPRQLAALHSANLYLARAGREVLPAPVTVLEATKAAVLATDQGASTGPITECLRPLLKIPGVRTLADLLTPEGTHVLSVDAVWRLHGTGARGSMPRRQATALRRLTCILCEGVTKWEELKQHTGYPAPLPASKRKITISGLVAPPPGPPVPDITSRMFRPERPPARVPAQVPTAQPAAGAAKRRAPQQNPNHTHRPNLAGVPAPVAKLRVRPSERDARLALQDGGSTAALRPPPSLAGNAARLATWQETALRAKEKRERCKSCRDCSACATAAQSDPNPWGNRSQRCSKHAPGWDAAKKKQTGCQRCFACPTGEAIHNIPTQQAVDASLSYQALTVTAAQRKKGQTQYEVTWAPNLVPARRIPAILAAYPDRATVYRGPAPRGAPAWGAPLRPQQAGEWVTDGRGLGCDLCLGHDPAGGVTCGRCGKWWHQGCLDQHDFVTAGAPDWECPACDDLASLAARLAQGADGWVAWVHWQPTWETRAAIEAVSGGPEALAAYETERATAEGPAPACPDAGLPNDLRQNPDARRGTWISTAADPVRARVTLVHDRANPHLDTHPTGSYELAIRGVQLWDSKEKALGPCAPLAVCTRPDGHSVGTLTPAHLQALRDRYRPGDGSITFEAQVAGLLVRCGVKDRLDEWTVAPPVMAAFSEAFGVATEHAQSAMLAHPRHAAYSSPDRRDEAFGAALGPYTHLWRGVNAIAAGPDHPALDKAFRWAVASAVDLQAAGTPSATLIFARADTGGQASFLTNTRLAPPHLCSRLAVLPAACGPVAGRDAWSAASPGKQGIVQVWLVWNALGAAAWQAACGAARPASAMQDAPAWAWQQLQAAVSAALPGTGGSGIDWGACPSAPSPDPPQTAIQRPGGFGRVKKDTIALPTGATAPMAEVWATYAAPAHLARLALRWDWERVVYTDGSSKDHVCGAGVWFPAPMAPKRKRTPLPGALTIDPAGDGPSNTITRAELAAIWAALTKGATTVATDSAASLWMIQRALLNPNSLRQNRLHRPLLLAILELLRAAGGPVELIKVKAHTGVVGNEMADLAANDARERKVAGKPCDLTCDVRAHELADTFWPCVRPSDEGGEDRETDKAGDDAPSGPHYLANVKKGVAEHMRAAHRLGSGNVAVRSWRYTALQQLGAQGSLRLAPSNAFMTSSLVSIPAKRAVLLCRTGGLYTSRLAKLYKHRDDDLCPLCRRPDGVSHALGGCQHRALRGMFQERHNLLGRMLLSEVARGSCGAALLQTDVGCRTKLEEGGLPDALLPESARRVPRHLLSADVTDAEWAAFKPDGLLSWFDEKAKLRRTVLIELKVTSDFDPSRALDAAEAQHARLLQALRKPVDKANSAPPVLASIVMGATGVTSQASHTALTRHLGVTHARADALLENMALALARSTHAIVRTRRRLEACAGAHNRQTAAPGTTKGRTPPVGAAS